MSRFIRILSLRSLALPIATGLVALFAAVLLADPGGLGALLRDVPLRLAMPLGFLLALTIACMPVRLRGQPRPVPVRVRIGARRLPR